MVDVIFKSKISLPKTTQELLAKRAQRLIQEHDSRKPFFLYLPFQGVHIPLQVQALNNIIVCVNMNLFYDKFLKMTLCSMLIIFNIVFQVPKRYERKYPNIKNADRRIFSGKSESVEQTFGCTQ